MKHTLFGLRLGLAFALAFGLGTGVSFAQAVENASDTTAPQKTEVPSEPPSVWLQRAAQAYERKDFAGVEAACRELVKQRPYIAEYAYLLAKSYALQEKRSQAYDMLIQIAAEGAYYDLDVDPDMANIRGFQVYDYVQSEFAKNAQPRGDYTQAMTLNAKDHLLSAMAWDAKAQQWLVGSLRQGTVSRVDAEGVLKTLVDADQIEGGVLDIAIDEQRRLLWVSMAGVPHRQGMAAEKMGRTGVLQFNLDSGELIKRHLLVPDGKPHLLSRMSVAPNGDLYVIDARLPLVYRIQAEQGQLALYLGIPGRTALRDVLVDPSGRQMFVADYEQGLLRVDLASNQVYNFGQASKLNLGGIDALEWHKDSLIALQNGNEPARVMRLALDATGTRIAHAQPMLAAQDIFASPSVIATIGADLYMLPVNEQHHYDGGTGKLLAAELLATPAVIKTNLETDWEPRMSVKPPKS